MFRLRYLVITLLIWRSKALYNTICPAGYTSVNTSVIPPLWTSVLYSAQTNDTNSNANPLTVESCDICPVPCYNTNACPTGRYRGISDHCTNCPIGKYQGDNNTQNIECKVHTLPCSEGTYQTISPTASIDRKCTDCAAGRADTDMDASTQCKACDTGTYSAVGQTECTDHTLPCSEGTYQTISPTASIDRKCSTRMNCSTGFELYDVASDGLKTKCAAGKVVVSATCAVDTCNTDTDVEKCCATQAQQKKKEGAMESFEASFGILAVRTLNIKSSVNLVESKNRIEAIRIASDGKEKRTKEENSIPISVWKLAEMRNDEAEQTTTEAKRRAKRNIKIIREYVVQGIVDQLKEAIAKGNATAKNDKLTITLLANESGVSTRLFDKMKARGVAYLEVLLPNDRASVPINCDDADIELNNLSEVDATECWLEKVNSTCSKCLDNKLVSYLKLTVKNETGLNTYEPYCCSAGKCELNVKANGVYQEDDTYTCAATGNYEHEIISAGDMFSGCANISVPVGGDLGNCKLSSCSSNRTDGTVCLNNQEVCQPTCLQHYTTNGLPLQCNGMGSDGINTFSSETVCTPEETTPEETEGNSLIYMFGFVETNVTGECKGQYAKWYGDLVSGFVDPSKSNSTVTVLNSTVFYTQYLHITSTPIKSDVCM